MAVQPFIGNFKFTRRKASAKSAIKYFRYRPRADGERPRQIFTRDRTITTEEAMRRLDEHQHGRYLVHTLLLSPPDEERPEDLREMTRHIVRELEKDKGCRMEWMAVEHHNTEHPHVHLVVCGGAYTEDGESVGVRFEKPDVARVKQLGRDYCREAARERAEWERSLELACREYDRQDEPRPAERAVPRNVPGADGSDDDDRFGRER
jgi:hypothetical protein